MAFPSGAVYGNAVGAVHDRAHAVLSYWFGDDYNTRPLLAAPPESFTKRWFNGGTEVDKYIVDNFSSDLAAVARGDYDQWLDNPFNCMAGIILMDQFSRNAFRGTSQAFALDSTALKWANHLIESGTSQALPPVIRSFLYLSFMHSERLEDQQRCVALYQEEVRQMQASVPAGQPMPPEVDRMLGMFNFNVKFAQAHEVLIAKWGRFPHRNAILGRTSTPEEKQGLEEGTIAKF